MNYWSHFCLKFISKNSANSRICATWCVFLFNETSDHDSMFSAVICYRHSTFSQLAACPVIFPTSHVIARPIWLCVLIYYQGFIDSRFSEESTFTRGNSWLECLMANGTCIKGESGAAFMIISHTCCPLHRWRRTGTLPPPRSLSDALPAGILSWQGSLRLPALHSQLWTVHRCQHMCQMSGTVQTPEWGLPSGILWHR